MRWDRASAHCDVTQVVGRVEGMTGHSPAIAHAVSVGVARVRGQYDYVHTPPVLSSVDHSPRSQSARSGTRGILTR